MPPVMTALFACLASLCRSSTSLRLENLALRHHLAVYKQTIPRPRLRRSDRLWRDGSWSEDLQHPTRDGWQVLVESRFQVATMDDHSSSPLPIGHRTDNKEVRVQQNVIAALPHCEFQTLDVFCSHPLGIMDIEVGVFVFVLLQRDIHLGLRGQVLNPGRQLGEGAL